MVQEVPPHKTRVHSEEAERPNEWLNKPNRGEEAPAAETDRYFTLKMWSWTQTPKNKLFVEMETFQGSGMKVREEETQRIDLKKCRQDGIGKRRRRNILTHMKRQYCKYKYTHTHPMCLCACVFQIFDFRAEEGAASDLHPAGVALVHLFFNDLYKPKAR